MRNQHERREDRPFHPPLWGNFVYYADHDLLSMGVLAKAHLFEPSLFHAGQALEKYLKALILADKDPMGARETAETQPWIQQHDLARLARRGLARFPHYSDFIPDPFNRIASFNTAMRYPWRDAKGSASFSVEKEIRLAGGIIERLRNDLPIQVDDYPLGIALRGRFHRHGRPRVPRRQRRDTALAVAALRELLPNVDDMVRV